MELSDLLAQEVGEDSCLIISSTAPRAKQSAAVIAEKLCQSFEQTDDLWTCERFSYRPTKIMDLVQQKESSADCLILVSHLELVKDFPNHFANSYLKTRLFGREIPKGTAFVIDCHNRNMRLVG